MKDIKEKKTLSSFIVDYIGRYESGRYQKSTVYKTRSVIRYWINFLAEQRKYLNVKDLESVHLQDLKAFEVYLLDGLKLKKTTLNSHIYRIIQFLSFAGKEYGLSIPVLKELEKAPKPEGVENFPAEFQKVYFEYAEAIIKSGRPKRSINRVKFMVRTLYRYLAEERKIQRFIDIRRADVKEFTRYLMDLNPSTSWQSQPGASGQAQEGKKRYSASSLNIFLPTIRGFLLFLSKQGVCLGLAELVHCVKRETYLSKNILSRKELVKLFNVKAENLEEFMMKTIIVLLYGSGLRIGEVVALKFKDIDLEKKEACIFESKTNKERSVQLGEVSAEYLRLYIDCVRDLIGYEKPKNDNIFVSLSHAEKADSNTVNRHLKIFCRRAGIKKLITCHCFRHSFGTHLLENGAGIKEVSELLGHEDLATTERYTRLNPEYLRQTLLKYHPREHETIGGEPL